MKKEAKAFLRWSVLSGLVVDWVSCMRSGAFAQAWRIGDGVLARRDPAWSDDPGLPYHLRWVWDGTLPDGLEVLVRCYHGLGDTLQFVRFLPALRARAAYVTLEAQAELCPLLASIPGVDRLVAFDQARPLPPSACTMEIMELAQVLRADPGAMPGVPYVTVPPHRLARGRVRAVGKIGLCWKAGDWDPARSVDLDSLLDALAEPGRRFISLQRGAGAAQATHPWFSNPGDTDCDVLETAALISGASHTVTVDTMVAHLAGALGCKATVLLKPQPDWRWPAVGTRSIWYPTLHIIRGWNGGRITLADG